MQTLAEMGDAARRCSNVDYRVVMQEAVMDTLIAIQQFEAYPSTETMRDLNGAWANAVRVNANMPPEGAPAPLSGSTEPARLAA
jgi:hypothetical protein